MRRTIGLAGMLVAAALLALGPAGCAYYNTFYTAKKSFELAEQETRGSVDPEGRPVGANSANYDKAIDWSRRVITDYPTSKWVDDARLVIGRSQLAKGDYDGAIKTFEEMRLLQPESDLIDRAMFYSGVAHERNRERSEALALYDSVLAIYPKTHLEDEVRFRRASLYITLKQPERGEADLKELATRKGPMGYDAALKLAEAEFASRRFADARTQFEHVAERAPTDKQRLDARLRVGDCDEALSEYARAAETYSKLLRDSQLPDARARARLRYGSALALSGSVDPGLQELEFVVQDMPRTPYSAEAMYRMGYINEVVRDDFDAARGFYSKVAEQQQQSPFVAQAKQRGDNLARVADVQSAASDTTAGGRAAQAAFESAELYLFQLGKFDKALEEYERAEREDSSAAWAPRAALARGWILSRRMSDPEGAKRAWESVITRWPGSDAARTARRALDHPADSTFASEPIALTTLQVPLVPGNQLYVPPPPVASNAKSQAAAKGPARTAAGADSLRRAPTDSLAATNARADSLHALADSLGALPDSLHAPTDTLKSRADSTARTLRQPPRDSTSRFKP